MRGTYPIAHGTPAEPGEDGRVELDCVKGHADTLAQSLVANFAGALSSATLEEVTAANVSGITVAPGQVVAHIVHPAEYGGNARQRHAWQAVDESGAVALVAAGNHTRLDGDQLVAEVFGYVRRGEETFEVVPPVWVREGGMEAYLIHFPELLRHES